MKLAGFPLHSKWTSEEYLEFLRKNGWTVQKSTVLKASFPLAYRVRKIGRDEPCRYWNTGRNMGGRCCFPLHGRAGVGFADTIAQLSQSWHVFQVVYDGHQPEYPGDFTSVEQTVDAVISYLKSCGISQLDGAYGCSMGGACLTRMLALGEMPIGRAIIDGGITPYQLPFLMRKLLLARDVLSFKMAANSRKVLEAAFPPKRFTPAGHDPKKNTTPWQPI